MAIVFARRTGLSNTADINRLTSSSGSKFNTIQPQLPYLVNQASGGTISEVSNYNGTGQLWRIHRFTTTGTFTVGNGQQPFRYLVVGAGTTGGGTNAGAGSTWGQPGGAGGRVLDSQNQILAPGTHAASVATTSGAASFFTGVSSSAGLAGGGGGNGGACGNATPGGPGGAGPTSNIMGVTTNYGGGGGGGVWGQQSCPQAPIGTGGAGGGGNGTSGDLCQSGGAGGANTGGGGGGSAACGPGGSSGGAAGSGIVIVAYRTAYVTQSGF